MNADLVREYKRILASLLNALVREQIPHIVTMLERVPDDTSDLREQFAKKAVGERVPAYWISILRVLRFSQVLKLDIQQNYELILSAYRTLTNRSGRTGHQDRLHRECGEALYRVDEVFGEHDRTLLRLVEETNRLLVQRFGIQPEPDENFYRMVVNPEDAKVIEPLMSEVIRLCDRMLELLRILDAINEARELVLAAD